MAYIGGGGDDEWSRRLYTTSSSPARVATLAAPTWTRAFTDPPHRRRAPVAPAHAAVVTMRARRTPSTPPPPVTSQKRAREGGQVYLLEERNDDGVTASGFYKIGKATSSEQRIAALRTGNARAIVQIYSIFVDDPYEAETRLHARFSQERVRRSNAGTEWFRFMDAGRAAKHAFRAEMLRQEGGDGDDDDDDGGAIDGSPAMQSLTFDDALFATTTTTTAPSLATRQTHVAAMPMSVVQRVRSAALTPLQRDVVRFNSAERFTYEHWLELVPMAILERNERIRRFFANYIAEKYGDDDGGGGGGGGSNYHDYDWPASEVPSFEALLRMAERVTPQLFKWPRMCDIWPRHMHAAIARRGRFGPRQRATLGW